MVIYPVPPITPPNPDQGGHRRTACLRAAIGTEVMGSVLLSCATRIVIRCGDGVVAEHVRHGCGQRQRRGFPDPGFIPPSETSIDRVPVAVFGRDIPPRRSATQSPEYPIDNRAVVIGAATAPPVLRFNRQQTLQNTPLRLAQIAPAQPCLQKAGLN